MSEEVKQGQQEAAIDVTGLGPFRPEDAAIDPTSASDILDIQLFNPICVSDPKCPKRKCRLLHPKRDALRISSSQPDLSAATDIAPAYSMANYIAPENVLAGTELAAFRGAGILPLQWIRQTEQSAPVLKALLTLENRGSEGKRLHVFGGQRDRRDRVPQDTACREMEEESNGVFTRSTALKWLEGNRRCVWRSAGKYVLFVILLSDPQELLPLQFRDSKLKNKEVTDILWLDWEELRRRFNKPPKGKNARARPSKSSNPLHRPAQFDASAASESPVDDVTLPPENTEECKRSACPAPETTHEASGLLVKLLNCEHVLKAIKEISQDILPI